MKKLLFLPLLLLLAGCSASWYQARDIKKLDALAIQQQPEFKRLANLLDPCFIGPAKSDTTYKHDTLIIAGITKRDTVRKKDTVIITNTIKLPGINITNTQTIRDTVADNRALGAVQVQLKVKADSLLIKNTLFTKVTQTSNKKTYWIIGLAVVLAITWGIGIYKFFTTGALKSIV